MEYLIQNARRLGPVAVIALLIIALAGLAPRFQRSVYYPQVIVEVKDNLKLVFLNHGRSSSEDCQTSAAAITRIVGANCPNCRIEVQSCPSKLEPELARLLSQDPVSIPSSPIPDGVIAYKSPSQEAALLTCRETERLTRGNRDFHVTCYPPNTSRRSAVSPAQQPAGLGQVPVALLILTAIAFIGYLIVFDHSVRSSWYQVFPQSGARNAPARHLFNRISKRTFDVLVSVPLFLVVAPILLCTAIVLLASEGRPIFYLSTRYIGLNRAVRVLKFRTMVRDAVSPRYRLIERFMRDGYLDIPLTCEVYTSIGRILERLQIVELPQLVNVLFDGMSLVGNRPLPKDNVDLLARFPSWEVRFASPGGITGISQIVGKLNLTPVQRLKLESLYSRVYLEGNIIKCDLMIMWVTAAKVLLRNEGITLERAEALLNSCLPGSQR